MEPSLYYSSSQISIGPAVVDQLRRTRGWVLFFAVMMWIAAVFLLLGGVAMVGMGVFAGALGEEVAADLAAVGGLSLIGVVYLVMAFLYIYPALKLTRFSSRIRDLVAIPSEQNLVAALNEQRSFWKFAGVMTVLMMALYAVFILVMLVAGVAGGVAAGTA